MPRELSFTTPTVEDLIGRSTIGDPLRVRKRSRTKGLPRLKLENGYYIPRHDQVGHGSWPVKIWTLPVIGGLAAAILAFSAGAHYEWRQADHAFAEHLRHSEFARPATVNARLARGRIQNLAAKPQGTWKNSPTEVPSPPKDALNPSVRGGPTPFPGERSPTVTPLSLPSAPVIGLRPAQFSASDAISIPSIPSILSAQIPQPRVREALVHTSTSAYPASEPRPEERTRDARDSGVHVSLLSGQHEQPTLDLAVPSGVNVALLPRPSSAPVASAGSRQIQKQASRPESSWRVVTVLGHGVVIQRDGQPMQIIKIGARLPDGSTLSSVNPGIGQWESDRSSPKPTKPTKDVDHGSATSKSQ